jgi:hypothetical protein
MTKTTSRRRRRKESSGFGGTLSRLRHGFLMTRLAWGFGLYLEMDDSQLWVVHGDPADMSRSGGRQLWQPTTEDVLAEDWRVAESRR